MNRSHPKPDPGTAMPVIDMAALAEIMGTDEAETINDILAEFLAIAAATHADVESAMASGAPSRIKATAHGAKGDARCAGASGLAELYAELERNAADSDRTPSDRLVRSAANELRNVESFVRDRLKAARHG